MSGTTVGETVDRAVAALEALGALGERVEDEWQYVADLVTVYRGRLTHVASTRTAEPVAPEAAGAVDTAIEEAGLITDPHRAMDWLSTLPQVILFALGETA